MSEWSSLAPRFPTHFPTNIDSFRLNFHLSTLTSIFAMVVPTEFNSQQFIMLLHNAFSGSLLQ